MSVAYRISLSEETPLKQVNRYLLLKEVVVEYAEYLSKSSN